MNKDTINKILIGLLAFSVIGIIIYFAYSYNKQNKPLNLISPNNTGEGDNNTTNGNYNDTIDRNKILRIGDAGNNVVELQKVINQKISAFGMSIPQLVTDGIFGQQTENSVRALVIGRFSSPQGNITINAVASLIPLSASPTYTNTKIIY